MTKIAGVYRGKLRCEVVHQLSQTMLTTDAPLDNQGRGESFSPTDLVGTALMTCVATMMGIVAEEKGIDIAGMTMSVEKKMSVGPPRKIAVLIVELNMAKEVSQKEKGILEHTARGCPVHQSLHKDVRVMIHFNW